MVRCSGSVRKIEPNSPLPRSYYRLYCKVVGETSENFDIFHQLSKRPFTKKDCKESGCVYSAWNEMVSSKHVIIDAEWGVSEQYAITVVQLRVCKVPTDHNVNRIVTYTISQLNDEKYCTGLHTRHDSFGKSVWKSVDYRTEHGHFGQHTCIHTQLHVISIGTGGAGAPPVFGVIP